MENDSDSLIERGLMSRYLETLLPQKPPPTQRRPDTGTQSLSYIRPSHSHANINRSPLSRGLLLEKQGRWGMGHQQSFFKTHWKFALSHGGQLRQKKLGRGQRPLSSKEAVHLVLKCHRGNLKYKSLRAPANFWVINKIFQRYAKRFGVKIEQVSIQSDHCHLLVRCPRRSLYQAFFRVVAGQISQRLEKLELLTMTDTPAKTGGKAEKSKHRLWIYRPFTRVVRGYRSYLTVRNYIQLNEQEALGRISYQFKRLRGLSMSEWSRLWT